MCILAPQLGRDQQDDYSHRSGHCQGSRGSPGRGRKSKSRSHDTSRKSLGQTHGPGGGGVSARVPLGVVATSGSSRSLPIRGRSGRSWHISANRSNRRLGGGRQAGSERPGAHPGDRSTPLTSRSSVRRCLRKCHWPGYPLPVVPQPLLQHLVVKILHRNLSPGHLSGSDASRLAQYHPDRFHAD